MSKVMAKTWKRPTVKEVDIAERTRLEGGPGDDGLDPEMGS